MARESAAYPPSINAENPRPKTVAECEDMGTEFNPCPFVSCKWHLYLEVTDKGHLRHNFPGKELWELPHTCLLKAVESGQIEDNVDVGRHMNVHRSRVQQLLKSALPKLKEGLEAFHKDIEGDVTREIEPEDETMGYEQIDRATTRFLKRVDPSYTPRRARAGRR